MLPTLLLILNFTVNVGGNRNLRRRKVPRQPSSHAPGSGVACVRQQPRPCGGKPGPVTTGLPRTHTRAPGSELSPGRRASLSLAGVSRLIVLCMLSFVTERKPGMQIGKTLSKAVILRTVTYAFESPARTAHLHPRHTHTGHAPGLIGGDDYVTPEAGVRGPAGAVCVTDFEKPGRWENLRK